MRGERAGPRRWGVAMNRLCVVIQKKLSVGKEKNFVVVE